MRYRLLTILLPCTFLGSVVSIAKDNHGGLIRQSLEQSSLEPFRGMAAENVGFDYWIALGPDHGEFEGAIANALHVSGLDLGWSKEPKDDLAVHLHLVARITEIKQQQVGGELTGMSCAIVSLEVNQLGYFARRSGWTDESGSTEGAHGCLATIYKTASLHSFPSTDFEDTVLRALRKQIDAMKIAVHSQKGAPTSGELIRKESLMERSQE